MFVDAPLLNVVPGSKEWNGTNQIIHKVGNYQDVKYLPKNVIQASIDTIVEFVIEFENVYMLLDLEKYLDKMILLLNTDIDKRVFMYRELVDEFRKSIS